MMKNADHNYITFFVEADAEQLLRAVHGTVTTLIVHLGTMTSALYRQTTVMHKVRAPKLARPELSLYYTRLGVGHVGLVEVDHKGVVAPQEAARCHGNGIVCHVLPALPRGKLVVYSAGMVVIWQVAALLTVCNSPGGTRPRSEGLHRPLVPAPPSYCTPSLTSYEA